MVVAIERRVLHHEEAVSPGVVRDGDFGSDVLEMWSSAADHGAHADECVVAFRGRSPITGAQTSEAGVFVGTGEPLETAIRESRFVAAVLYDYLRQFPPGSQCETEVGGSGPGPGWLSPTE